MSAPGAPDPPTHDDVLPDGHLAVSLLGLPVELHAEAAAHGDALLRELEMLRRAGAAGALPDRLRVLVAAMHERFGAALDMIDAGVAQAAAFGRQHVDLRIVAPVAAGEACRELGDLLDELDERCRAGDELLTLAATPEVTGYRTWFLGQFTAQASGAAPSRWAASGTTEDALAGFRVELVGDTPRVVAPDDVDLATAPALRSILGELRAEGHHRVTVDLSTTAFVDSVGVSVLVAAHTRLHDDGGELRIVIGPRARRLFELTGLDGVLHLVDDRP